jgi:CRP-like cAMP-binding protein
MDKLIDNLNLLHPLKGETISFLRKNMAIKYVSKNDILLKKDQISKELFWIKSGILRGYRETETNTMTTWFAIEGDMVTSVSSFMTQNPSNESIQALEDSQLYVISYSKLQELYTVSLEMNIIGRLLTEQYYINLEKRAFLLLNATAKERYDAFVERYPQLLLKISLGVIASFIGVTQSSLSRIRKLKH